MINYYINLLGSRFQVGTRCPFDPNLFVVNFFYVSKYLFKEVTMIKCRDRKTTDTVNVHGLCRAPNTGNNISVCKLFVELDSYNRVGLDYKIRHNTIIFYNILYLRSIYLVTSTYNKTSVPGGMLSEIF